MMDFATWKTMILKAVTQISDREFQARTWFGAGEEISSPDELFNTLFDDAMVETFLTTQAQNLTHEQRQAGNDLVSKMNQYAAVTPEQLNPFDTIDDPRWKEIRYCASAFARALEDRENVN